jgi:hypothetical protein
MTMGDDQNIAVVRFTLGLAYHGRLPPVANILDQPVYPFSDLFWAPVTASSSVIFVPSQE